VRWRRDDRQQLDDSTDLPAEEWLSQFRPVRPDALTSADPDAVVRQSMQPGSGPSAPDWAGGSTETGRGGRGLPRAQPDAGRADSPRGDGSRNRRRGSGPRADGGWSDGDWSDGDWSHDDWSHDDRSDSASSDSGRSDRGGSDRGWSDGGWSPAAPRDGQTASGRRGGRSAPAWGDDWDDERSGGSRSDGGRSGRERGNDSWAQLAARPIPPSRRADPGGHTARRADASPAERPWSGGLDESTGQLPVADARSFVSERRPDLGPTSPSQLPGLGSLPQANIDRAAGPDLGLRRSADVRGGGHEKLPDPWRSEPNDEGHGGASRLEQESRRSGNDGREPRDEPAHHPDPRRPSANGLAERDGYRRSGPSLPSRPGEPRDRGADDGSAASDWNARRSRDSLQAGFERDAPGYRDDRRGLERDRGGFGIEPADHGNGRRSERDRGGFGIEPADHGNERESERDRGGFGIEPGSFGRDDHRPTPQQPDRADFELGPDAYRDDGRGVAADRRTFLPSRVSVDPGPSLEAGPSLDPGPSLDQRHAYDQLHRPELERPDRQRPAQRFAWAPSSKAPAERDDDTVTAPLPIILPGAISLPRPAPVAAPRGPFEPAQASQPLVRPSSVTGSVEPPPAVLAEPAIPLPPDQRVIPPAAAAKLDQLKELYLTAEAIGEDALDKHFEQVSQRQQELIREFFQRSKENDDVPS
jgi:hypothetical protein